MERPTTRLAPTSSTIGFACPRSTSAGSDTRCHQPPLGSSSSTPASSAPRPSDSVVPASSTTGSTHLRLHRQLCRIPRHREVLHRRPLCPPRQRRPSSSALAVYTSTVYSVCSLAVYAVHLSTSSDVHRSTLPCLRHLWLYSSPLSLPCIL